MVTTTGWDIFRNLSRDAGAEFLPHVGEPPPNYQRGRELPHMAPP
jgi:hypothetical protein